MRFAPNPARRRCIPAALALMTTSILLAAATGANAAVIYVDPAAAGLNNGNNWGDAFTDLQSALAASGSSDQLWLVQATYTPHASDRSVSFVIPDGVTLYGGFVGGETAVIQRGNVWATVLSGEIGSPATTLDNSYHVVDVSGTSASTQINGCTITAGHADGAGPGEWNGGGIYCEGGSPNLFSISVYQNFGALGGGIYVGGGGTPNISGVSLFGNDTSGHGGGMACFDSNPTLLNVSASSNTAEGSGGGIYYENSGGTIVAFLFSSNSAVFGGGGMFCYNSTPTITNARFVNNGADYGAGLVTGDASHVQLINPTFNNNTATTTGGAIQCQTSSNPQVVNGILWGNSGGGGGNEIYVIPLTGGTPVVSYSDIEGGIPPAVTDGGNNIDADPLFLGDLRPGPFSPCIDTGNTAANPESGDALLRPRVIGAAIDMGALEYECPAGPMMYVDQGSFSFQDGDSWSSAYRDLQVGLNTADFCSGVNEVWVADGTYRTSPLPADRSLSFELVNGIGYYGGFNGTETLRSQRDWQTYETILTGEIGTSGPADNAYHVVRADHNDQTAVLDGFTIRGGNADGGGLDDIGAGVLVEGGNPVLHNLVIEDNAATFLGGGMANLFSAFPDVRNATIRNNSANSGGGVENDGSSPTFTNVVIEGNSASDAGGGMENFGGNQPQLVNVVFVGNSANFGGGMANNESWPSLTNVTFGGNSANVRGGAMYNITFSGPSVVNSVLSGNTASVAGNEVFNEPSGGAPSPSYAYSLISSSGGSGSWDTGLGTDNGNNIDGPPLYFDLPGGDLRLQNLSPAVNTGDSPSNVEPTDVAGETRILGVAIDMGAYEFPAPTGATTPQVASGNGIQSAHPNPFNPTVTITYEVRDSRRVTLAVYDVRGALVTTLVDERIAAGTHSVRWDGRDARGARVSSGVYLVRMVAGSETSLRKVVMLK